MMLVLCESKKAGANGGGGEGDGKSKDKFMKQGQEYYDKAKTYASTTTTESPVPKELQ